ncbi:hypothetical protein C8R41DRAFT_866846, partial [Lentinula lateritia]
MSYISLPYPTLPDVPPALVEDLNNSHRQHLKLHAIYGEESRKTRQTTKLISANIIEQWAKPWIKIWMEDEAKRNVILDWLAQAICVDFEQIPSEGLNVFLSVQ